MIIEQDSADPWRIPLETSPAWLQLEQALAWYDQALTLDNEVRDPGGRTTLLRALTLNRLNHHQQAFDELVLLLRTRKQPVITAMAILAVGDHHFREGRYKKARTAYRMVRKNRNAELAAYATYRFASCYAVNGESARAEELLHSLLEQPPTTPLLRLIRVASASALSNHVALYQPLKRWIELTHDLCEPGDDACRLDVRQSAIASYDERGQHHWSAWLSTVDTMPQLEADRSTRIQLAEIGFNGSARDLLHVAESTCAQRDIACQREYSHQIARYHEAIQSPDAGWLIQYERLPKLAGKPAINQRLGLIVQEPENPRVELQELEALCNGDSSCLVDVRIALGRAYSTSWRLMDARWIYLLDSPVVIEGQPVATALLDQVTRLRLAGPEALDQFESSCDTVSCIASATEALFNTYEQTGQRKGVAFLLAHEFAPTLPLPSQQRAIATQVVRESIAAPEALDRMLQSCAEVNQSCFVDVRGALEVLYRIADSPSDANWLANLAILGELEIPYQSFVTFLATATEELHAEDAMDRIEPSCPPMESSCIPIVHLALVGWYENQEQWMDVRSMRHQLQFPPLRGYSKVRRLFSVIADQDPPPKEALNLLIARCPVNHNPCHRAAASALAEWYAQSNRMHDARLIRSSPLPVDSPEAVQPTEPFKDTSTAK